MNIEARPLTPDGFNPFGDVLMGLGNGPERHEFAARFQNPREDARPNLTFMRVPVEYGAIVIRTLERHPYSNQVFVPLSGTSHLVVVCPSMPGGEPDLGGLSAFIATGSQAVNYGADVWHAPRTALGAPGEFVMFRWDNGSDSDTEVIALESAIAVTRGDDHGLRG